MPTRRKDQKYEYGTWRDDEGEKPPKSEKEQRDEEIAEIIKSQVTTSDFKKLMNAKAIKDKREARVAKHHALKEKHQMEAKHERAQNVEYVRETSNKMEMGRLRKTFNKVDLNKDETFTPAELSRVLRNHGQHFSPEDCARMLWLAGVENIDNMDFEAFLAIVPRYQAYRRRLEKQIMEKFQKYDVERAGEISTNDVVKLIKAWNISEEIDPSSRLTQDDIKRMARRADTNTNGTVFYGDLVEVLLGSQATIPYELPPLPPLPVRVLRWLGRKQCCLFDPGGRGVPGQAVMTLLRLHRFRI